MIKIITTYGQLLLIAMGRTLLLAFLGLIFACILGMIFGLLSVVKNKACNIIAQIFVFVIRGVPMIVLAFYVFFGICSIRVWASETALRCQHFRPASSALP